MEGVRRSCQARRGRQFTAPPSAGLVETLPGRSAEHCARRATKRIVSEQSERTLCSAWDHWGKVRRVHGRKRMKVSGFSDLNPGYQSSAALSSAWPNSVQENLDRVRGLRSGKNAIPGPSPSPTARPCGAGDRTEPRAPLPRGAGRRNPHSWSSSLERPMRRSSRVKATRLEVVSLRISSAPSPICSATSELLQPRP